MAGSVHIPWYATGFRADRMEEGLAQIAPIALRYGATAYAVFRYRDDRYKFLQTATFESKLDWERYWNGEDFIRWRSLHSSFYQVPVLYQWTDVVLEGHLPTDPGYGGEPTAVTGGPASDEVGDTI
jgi:hypothetical protein